MMDLISFFRTNNFRSRGISCFVIKSEELRESHPNIRILGGLKVGYLDLGNGLG